jgi:hypothetical protein
MMASSFDISGPGSRQGDDDSSGSDREMQEHGGSKQFRCVNASFNPDLLSNSRGLLYIQP